MGRARDFTEDASVVLLAFFAYKAVRSLLDFKRDPWWQPDHTDKGGRLPGPAPTTQPVPQGGANVWSEDTMRLFDQQMRLAGIEPRVVLLGIASASNFNADEMLGGSTGLLLVQRSDLTDLGYPGVPAFEELDAPHQIPWIGKVLAYRISSAGGRAPTDVPGLAVLLHPANPVITEVLRNEAKRRSAEAEGTMLYINHLNLLKHVQADHPVNTWDP